LIVDSVDDTQRTGGYKIARDDADMRMRHGSVGQALTEGGFDIEADFPGGFLCTLQCFWRGRLHAAAKLLNEALQFELLVDLRTGTMHQYQSNAERREQGKVLNQGVERPVVHQLAAERHHKCLAAKIVDIRGDLSEPSYELRGCKFGSVLCG